MKKLLFLLLIPLSLLSYKAQATHVMGAEFEWENIGKDSFLIKVRLYRDCSGIAPSAGPINVLTNCGVQRVNTTITKIGDVTPVCTSVGSSCSNPSSTFKYGIELFELSGLYVATNDINNGCCVATLSWGQCCRTSAITTGASRQNFSIDAEVDFCQGMSSPTWNSPAVSIACLGRDQAIDNSLLSKDSIVYTCTSPLQTSTTTVTYSAGYSACAPLTFLGFPNTSLPFPRGFHLDPSTGQLLFRPMKEDQTVMATKADIYHNGVYVGYMKRDIQLIVIKCPDNSPPVLSGLNGTTPLPQNFTTTICAGKKSCFSIVSSDRDTSDTVRLKSNDGIPGATFTITNPGSKRENGEFCWTPSTSDISTFPYSFVVTATDDACPKVGVSARSYKIYVQKPYNFDLDLQVSGGTCGTYQLVIRDKNGRPINEAKWYENDSIYIGSGDSLVHSFAQTGNRKITVEVDDCINQSADTTLTVDSVSNIRLQLSDVETCQDEGLTLQPTVSGHTGSLSYNWNIDPNAGYSGPTNSSSVNLQLTNTVTTTFSMGLSVTDSIGCKASAQAYVLSKKNALLDLELNRLICEGRATQIPLSLVNGEGTWSGTNVASNTLNLNGLTSGSYLLKFKLEDSFSCISDTALIQYKELPILSISDDFSSCTSAPSTVQLLQNPSGGVWTGIGVTGNEFDPVAAGKGQYHLSYFYTDSLGCTNEDSVHVTVFDYEPTVTVADTVKACSNGAPVTITAQPAGGGWLGPGMASALNTIKIKPADYGSGTYTFVYGYADSNSCTNSDSTVLHLIPAPVASFKLLDTTYYKGDTVIISNQGSFSPHKEYSWSIGDPVFASASSFNFAQPIDSADTFHILLVVRDTVTGCIDSSLSVNELIVLTNTGIDYAWNGLEVYPNPSSGLLNIRTASNENLQVSLVNIAGKEVLQTNGVNGNTVIDLGDLESSMYLLQISQNGQMHSQLLMKQ